MIDRSYGGYGTTKGETKLSTDRGLEREADFTRIIPLQEETIPRIGITGVFPEEVIRTREEVLLGTEMATKGGTTAKVESRLVLGVAPPSTGQRSVYWNIVQLSVRLVVIYITLRKTVIGAILLLEQQGVNLSLKPRWYIGGINLQVGGHPALQGMRGGRNTGT